MEKNKYKFSNNIRELKIRTVSSDVFIHKGEVEQPVILNASNFEISEEERVMFIKEGTGKGNIVLKNNNQVIRFSNSIFGNGSFSNVQIGNITVNGKQIGNISISNATGEKLEIVIPKNHGTLSLYAKTTSGDITIEDLTMSKLLLESTSGDLVLSNVDLLNGNLKSVSGDISARIRNSQSNYKTSQRSVSGDVGIYNEEKEGNHTSSQNISTLNAETVSGDIKILFKGKGR